MEPTPREMVRSPDRLGILCRDVGGRVPDLAISRTGRNRERGHLGLVTSDFVK